MLSLYSSFSGHSHHHHHHHRHRHHHHHHHRRRRIPLFRFLLQPLRWKVSNMGTTEADTDDDDQEDDDDDDDDDDDGDSPVEIISKLVPLVLSSSSFFIRIR